MTKRKYIGKNGEKIAKEFLENCSYKILVSNYRSKRSEIDIICSKGEDLIFVEVKTRKNKNYGNPEEFVSETQIEKIHEGAYSYIIDNKWKGPIRFDIISIILDKDTIIELEHFKDAF